MILDDYIKYNILKSEKALFSKTNKTNTKVTKIDEKQLNKLIALLLSVKPSTLNILAI